MAVLRSFEDQIYEILKEKILSLELKLAEQVNIQELSKELKVSSTPIRDVLKRLSQERLVKIIPRVGYYVVDLQPEDLLQIYDLRKMFECYALETGIGNINTQKLLQIKKNTEKLQNIQSKDEERKKFNKTDRELHSLIIQSSPNERLHGMYLQIYNFVIISQRITHEPAQSVKEHLELINAILEKDIEKAKSRLKSHIENAANDGMEALRERLLEKKVIARSLTLL